MSAIEEKVVELRSVFDRARAIPFSSQKAETIEDLLAISLSGDPYAVRVTEVSALVVDRKIVGLPSRVPELLGVAGIRGSVVPVYSFAALLGSGGLEDRMRWLVLCGAEEPVGLAFSDFEGYVRVPSAQIYPANGEYAKSEHVKDVARVAGRVRAVVSIPHIIEAIKGRCGKASFAKER